MFDPQEEIRKAQRHAYWRRNSFSTCVVLTLVSMAAFLVEPQGLPLIIASVVGGSLAYYGGTRRGWWGTALAFAGLLLPAWPVWVLVPSRLLIWIQIIAPLFATILGLGLLLKGSAHDEP